MPNTSEPVEHLPEQEMAATQETISEEFGQSIRRGLDQAEAGQTVDCRDYNDMVERILGDCY